MGKRNSKKETEEQKKQIKDIGRKNFIDGLPLTYEVSFVLKTHKFCDFCKKKFLKNDIEENKIIYTDEFELSHKECLSKEGVSYNHSKEGDYSSPVFLTISKEKRLSE
jgi:hypothetical protein